MFSLHERAQIRLCRAAFIAVCVLPTALLLAWSAAARLPWYRQRHEAAIAALLHCDASLAAVKHLSPGVTLYEQLTLTDRESQRWLAKLPYVEVQTSGREVTIRLPHPSTINGDALDLVWSHAQAQLQRVDFGPRVALTAQNVTIELVGGPLTVADVAGEVLTADNQSRLKLEFRRAAAADGPRMQLALARDHGSHPAATDMHLATHEGELPLSLAAACCPGVTALGRECAFRGAILATTSAAGWSATLDGQLVQVDLDALFRNRFPHRLSGAAQVRLERAVINDGRLQRAGGQLSAGPGMIGGSLIRAGQTHLGWRAPPSLEGRSDDWYAFEQLAVAFTLDADGVVLKGACDTAPEALVAARGGVLVGESGGETLATVNLLRTLVPDREVQVPATLESAWLSNVLPLPSAHPAGRDEPAILSRTRNVAPLR